MKHITFTVTDNNTAYIQNLSDVQNLNLTDLLTIISSAATFVHGALSSTNTSENQIMQYLAYAISSGVLNSHSINADTTNKTIN